MKLEVEKQFKKLACDLSIILKDWWDVVCYSPCCYMKIVEND